MLVTSVCCAGLAQAQAPLRLLVWINGDKGYNGLQKVGDAFTIMTAEELPHVKDIERFIAQKVPRLKLDNFDYIYSAIFNEDSVTAALKGAKGVRTHKGTSFGGSRKRRR